MADKPLEVPAAGGGDIAHALANAGMGMVPIAGPVAQALFGWFVKAPIEKRRDEWMGQVGERLENIGKQGIRLEDLQNDPAFVDVIVQASAIAMNSRQEEKRQALLNAITNSALPSAPDEAKRQMFLRAVDTFTAWHLRLIKLFADPSAWFAENQKQKPEFAITSSLDRVVAAAFPELRAETQRDFCNLIWKELNDWGMINSGSLSTNMTPSGAWGKRTTSHGDEFLAFISDKKG